MEHNICIYLANTTYNNEATAILVCYPLYIQQLPTLGTLPKHAGNSTDFGDCPHSHRMLVRRESLVF